MNNELFVVDAEQITRPTGSRVPGLLTVEPGQVVELDPGIVTQKHEHPLRHEGGGYSNPTTGKIEGTTTRSIPWLKRATKKDVEAWCRELRRRAKELKTDDYPDGDPGMLALADRLESIPITKGGKKSG